MKVKMQAISLQIQEGANYFEKRGPLTAMASDEKTVSFDFTYQLFFVNNLKVINPVEKSVLFML